VISVADVAAATRVDDALEVLRSAGKRMTTARRVLLSCLLDGGSHRTAEDLAADAQAITPDVHLSTIYRNLEELEHLGVVEHVHLGHGPAIYHLATEHHGHFVCEDCGRVFEAPDELFAGLGKLALDRAGLTIKPHHFAVLGTCDACAGRAADLRDA
jgi:Fe2+ or Zn2+ uptake regulation protein